MGIGVSMFFYLPVIATYSMDDRCIPLCLIYIFWFNSRKNKTIGTFHAFHLAAIDQHVEKKTDHDISIHCKRQEKLMQTKSTTVNQKLKKQEGFTLVEVIAVLVILGILAAVAIPKFFDMQDTAREKAVLGAVGELNGQVALSFAQNALNGGAAGGYADYTGYIGEDFDVYHGATETSSGTDTTPSQGKIVFSDTPTHWWGIDWKAGDSSTPGFFRLGSYQTDGVALP